MSEIIQEPKEISPLNEAPRELKFKDSVSDWTLRAIIFIVFLYFGTGKLKTDPHTPWRVLFDQIGFGQWLRYVAAAIEIIGAFLVLFSASVEIGLVLLAITMVGATSIVLFVLHRPADAFLPFAVFCGLIALGLHRRRV